MDRFGRRGKTILLAGVALGLTFVPLTAAQPAQHSDLERATSIEVQPPSLTLEIGEKANLTATVRDDAGNVLPVRVIYLTRSRRNVGVTNDGEVEAYRPGQYTIAVRVPRNEDETGGDEEEPLTAEVRVTILQSPLDRIEVSGLSSTLYTGSLVRAAVAIYDTTDTLRSDEEVLFASSDPRIVEIDRFGHVTPRVAGTATLEIHVGELTEEIPVRVMDNPASSLELTADLIEARTGDVIRFEAVARDAQGNVVEDLPVFYSVQAHPVFENPAAPASAQVADDGRFVAELPGEYTVVANASGMFATATVGIEPRDVQKRVRVAGRGPVQDRHTSDLWVWEGADGRDYAITGTWRSDGSAYIWDVTDAADIRKIDTVEVDARTVNDVKVSEDGQLAVISREGVSNRRNGLVILDLSNPAKVETLAEYDEQLTGGVHNTFIYENHIYALSNGRRYDVINIAEPKLPFRVSSFELDTPGHSIHDVWIEDGIAYSSNWRDGVVLVDVGNGLAGGSPDNPVQFASYADPQGRTHAAFPFRSESTGKFYVIMGDEIFPNGMNPEGPTRAAGYMHIVDFTDSRNPVEVARFEVPEAGSHNLWIEDDILYAAFYNGGLRVVDLSGELMGDLYKQGREIAAFRPNDADGFVKNEAMVWGAQPHKGLIYVSDWNSGLWVVELVDETEAE